MQNNRGSIIVEGADQSGKSYVCAKLSEELGYPIHHFSAPKPGTDINLEYINPMIVGDANGYTGPFVFDRSYMSEIVYGEVMRGGTTINKESVEEFLNARHCILVYLKRKNYVWQTRDEMYTESDNEKIMRKYDEVYPEIGIPKIVTDSFDSDCIDKILALYKENNLD